MSWIQALTEGERALATAVLFAVVAALAVRGRGGRFRGMPGWAAWSAAFAVGLVALERLPAWGSFPLLGALMFFSLRAYYFLAPMRPADRVTILSSYAAIPLLLWPVYVATPETFLALVPVLLFLLAPVVLALSPTSEGLLDSMGRTILGVLVFLFCSAHLGLIARLQPGVILLFGTMVIVTEGCVRLVGRFEPGHSKLRRFAIFFAGVLIAGGIGYLLGPHVGVDQEQAARAGVLVGLALGCGAYVWHKVSTDLEITSSTTHLGRGGLLDRVVPAVYAAPAFYHYLNHFA